MSAWQAFAFPLAIAAAAGAAGGLWSWLRISDRVAAARAGGILGGGWAMFMLALGLSYAGLLVAGIVQPDEPVSLATPTTARYVARVFERPGPGAVVLGHHVALAPNEALWTLVAASGSCDVIRGSERADILCYRSFPNPGPAGRIGFGSAPPAYLLFVLAPAAATVLGGRRAAARQGRTWWSAVADGMGAGVVYGLLVGVGCLLASVTLSYAANAGAAVGGRLWIGPDPAAGTVTALTWGVVGGAIGGASRRLRWSEAAPRGSGTPAQR
jgi:hypothetical protein